MQYETLVILWKEFEDSINTWEIIQERMGYYARQKMIYIKEENMYWFLYALAKEQFFYMQSLFIVWKAAGYTFEKTIDYIQDVMMLSEAEQLFWEYFIDELMLSLIKDNISNSKNSFKDFFKKLNNTNQNQSCLPKPTINIWKRFIQYFLKM